MFKIGLGYDFHILEEGRSLMIGGLKVPFHKGEKAHSDGDVLLHAIIDSLIGASGIGVDIGELFPSNAQTWKDASSSKLLSIVWQKIKPLGYEIGNIDSVVIIEEPKLTLHREAIIKSICDILEVDKTQVSVKFKTHEKTGEIGQGEAIASFVTSLLYTKDV
ncbi:MAG: 2-C-methyl-D-erythritol 2,4-cyclodiphosphate synthase [Treponema sp.]